MIPPRIFRAPSTGRRPSQPNLVRPLQVPQASWFSWPHSPGLCDYRAGPFMSSGCLPLHDGAAVNPGAGSVRVCPPPSLSIVLGLSALKDFILCAAFPQSTGCWLSNSSSQSFTRGLSQAPFPRPDARPGLWSRSHRPSFPSPCSTSFLSPLVLSLAPAAHLVPPRLPAPSLLTVVCSEQRQDLYSQFVVAPQRLLHLKPQPTHSV